MLYKIMNLIINKKNCPLPQNHQKTVFLGLKSPIYDNKVPVTVIQRLNENYFELFLVQFSLLYAAMLIRNSEKPILNRLSGKYQ